MKTSLLLPAVIVLAGCATVTSATESVNETTLAMFQAEMDRDMPRAPAEMKNKLCFAYRANMFQPGTDFMRETYNGLIEQYQKIGRPFTPDVTESAMAQVYQSSLGANC